MVFCCEFPFSLFHSVVFLTLALFPLFWSAMPQALNSSSRFIFFFKLQGPGEMGWDGSPLFKLRLSKCFMHYNEKGHLYSHRALSVSPYICPSSETEYFRLLSLTTETRALFPTHHLFFLNPAFTPNSYTIPLFFPPHLFSVDARVPCFPLGCPVGCVNVPFQLCNIISWVVASCSVPLHNLSAPVCHSMRVPFLCLFEAQIWSPNGDGIKLGADNWAPHYPTSPHRSSLPAVRPVT